jgi:hypothetical protein
LGSILAFLLKRLYVKGSLDDTSTCFQVTIQNTLAPGTVVGLSQLQLAGIERTLQAVKAVLPDGSQVPALDVSAEWTVRISVGDRVAMRVEAGPLPGGSHRLVVPLETKEDGLLRIEVKDKIG